MAILNFLSETVITVLSIGFLFKLSSSKQTVNQFLFKFLFSDTAMSSMKKTRKRKPDPLSLLQLRGIPNAI